MEFKCCGLPMQYQEFFGVRRYMCQHRGHHDEIFVNLFTGQTICDADFPWTKPE